MLLCEPHSCYNFIDRDPLAHTATGVPSFIPDDTIIAMENHYYMPEITHNATVTLCYMPENTQLTLTVLGVIFTDSYRPRCKSHR